MAINRRISNLRFNKSIELGWDELMDRQKSRSRLTEGGGVVSSSLDSEDSNEKLNRKGSRKKNRKRTTDFMRRLPQAIIIGVKKCGTRALLEYLRLHPKVVAPGPEIHFFDRSYNKGLEWYRKQMPKSLPEQVTVEKSPSYFITPGVPQRIKNMSSSVKLLLAVRDPVQRAISDHAQSLSNGKIRTLEERVMKETNKREVDPESYIVKIGMYARHYRQWLMHFPKSQILLVSGEELVTDPAKVMADVQKFLNLEEVINEDYFFFNETKGFPCLKRDPNEAVPKCLDGSKGRPHPNVDPVVLETLRRYYKPLNEEFYKLVGTDFHWS